MPPEIVVVCESIHAVLALERALLAAGIPCDLVPTPRDLHSDCGMVLTLRAGDRERAAPLLRTRAEKIVGLYRLEAGRYDPIPRPEPDAGG